MPIINCQICGKEKYFRACRLKNGGGKFCSNQCRVKGSLGRKLSKTTCLKMSLSRQGEKHPMFGKKHTPESLAKMSASHLGTIHTSEHNFKISNALKGKQPHNLDFLHNFNKGENHKAWKGSEAKQQAIHDWINRHYGRPKECKKCGATSNEKRLTWANIDHKYRRIFSDFIGLCYKCHQVFDKENNNYPAKNHNQTFLDKNYTMPVETRNKISETLKNKFL
jgi:hypothetical protein